MNNRKNFLLIAILLGNMILSSCSTIPNSIQESEESTAIVEIFESENMGYDLAIRDRMGRTTLLYRLFDFDRGVVTEMQVHNSFKGEYKGTDHINTSNIAGDLDSGWYLLPGNDTHIYYDYSKENDIGIITQYNYKKQPIDTYREVSISFAVEYLQDGLDGKSSSQIARALFPQE